MSSKSRQLTNAKPSLTRQGEGTYVSVLSATGASVTIHLAEAPAPEKRYSANVADVVVDDGSLYFHFGQKKVGGEGWRSLLEISLPFEAVPILIGTFQELKPLREKVVAGLRNLPLTKVTDDPQHTASMRANMVQTGISGDDACMDFYYASPKSIGQATHSRQVGVEPIVRVMFPLGLLISAIAKVESLGPDLPKLTLRS
jgi:hypothetical protein